MTDKSGKGCLTIVDAPFFVRNRKNTNFAISNLFRMKKGDKVRISPDVTGLNDWIEGIVIDVEENRFNGIVITAETAEKIVFFGPQKFFELE